MKKKNLGFTLAEVLIVIGIIGVVAALTLPNLNHATGDKETVTRLQKAYSILNEANDRAVAIYGPISTWTGVCKNSLSACWMKRIGEFLKISKSCDESDSESDNYSSCNSLIKGDMEYGEIVYQLPDNITFSACTSQRNCDKVLGWQDSIKDICIVDINIDLYGPNKGNHINGQSIFRFNVSDSLGLIPWINNDDAESESLECISDKNEDECTWWVLEYGNLDYLKADSSGQCNDSNIILDGTTNTSCH